MKITIITSLLLGILLCSLPAAAQDLTLDQAAANVETAIQGAMSRAGQAGQPTLQQLGGVQAGSTDADASGGAGGDGGSSGGGSGGGPGGGQKT